MTIETEVFRIRLNFSFAATVTLMLCFCDERVVLTALLASFLHESGHVLFLRLFGCTPVTVTLSAFGMCIDRPPYSGLSLKKEIAIALGGIFFNLLSALLFTVADMIYPREMFDFTVAVNFIVAAMNSVPNINLDAGRALYYFLLDITEEAKAEGIMQLLSVIFALLILAFFVFYTAFYSFNISFAAVTIYIVILTFKREVDK